MGGVVINIDKTNDKEEIINRLKKIEGQVKGIQKMIDDEKCCSDVMIQISAIRSAINKVGGLIMDRYINECMRSSLKGANPDESIDEIISTIVKYVK